MTPLCPARETSLPSYPQAPRVGTMPADSPTILPTSGGSRYGRRTQREFNSLVPHAVELSGVHGRAPRLTFVGTASGGPRFMNYWAQEAGRVAGFDVTCLDLFPMPNLDDVPG